MTPSVSASRSSFSCSAFFGLLATSSPLLAPALVLKKVTQALNDISTVERFCLLLHGFEEQLLGELWRQILVASEDARLSTVFRAEEVLDKQGRDICDRPADEEPTDG